MENIWRGVVLGWSLCSAAGASLTFIMLRAALKDHALGRNNPELAVLYRRVVRGVGSRMIVFVSFVLASGTLWAVPAPAQNLADIVVRMGFSVVFALTSLALLILAIRDLLDTMQLLKDKPFLSSHPQSS